MTLMPRTLRRSPRTFAAACTAIALTGALGVLLALNLDHDSTPPTLFVVATAVALAWMWLMHLHRTEAEARADEQLIAILRGTRLDDNRRREEEAFREITRYFDEEGRSHGVD